MFKKLIFFYLAIIFLNFKPLLADSYIVAKVNNEIITNNDIAKEINYLELLNPNINSFIFSSVILENEDCEFSSNDNMSNAEYPFS